MCAGNTIKKQPAELDESGGPFGYVFVLRPSAYACALIAAWAAASLATGTR
jgi:hypothetical protein